jgi:hypothetical protein
MNAVYVVPAENRDTIIAKIEKMNRKATQLGTSPISVTFSHDHIETWTRWSDSAQKDIEYSREWLKAEVAGAVATLNGYYFRATLHHTTDGNIIASLPGYEVPREYRNAPSACDHCKTTRRRNATYLVESKDGLQQVGQNCVQDFFGGNDPHRMAKWAEMLGAFDSWFVSMSDEEGSLATRREDTVGLMTFLGQNAAVIRLDGWVSKKVASERELPATILTTWDALFGFSFTPPKERYKLQEKYKITEEDKAQALAIYTWAKESFAAEGAEPDNDYLHNLAVITRAGLVSKRTGGLAASMEAAWKRATKKQEERAAAPDSPSGHVGAIGDRLRGLPVTLLGKVDLPPTEWGTRCLVRLADDAGNIFTWFTNGDALYGEWDFGDGLRTLVDGDRMWLTGTIKRHGEFGGIKQTELSRCALASQAPVEKVKKTRKAKAEAPSLL